MPLFKHDDVQEAKQRLNKRVVVLAGGKEGSWRISIGGVWMCFNLTHRCSVLYKKWEPPAQSKCMSALLFNSRLKYLDNFFYVWNKAARTFWWFLKYVSFSQEMDCWSTWSALVPVILKRSQCIIHARLPLMTIAESEREDPGRKWQSTCQSSPIQRDLFTYKVIWSHSAWRWINRGLIAF